MSLNDSLQDLNGFVQEIRGTGQCHLELLHRFRPASFPLKDLKSAMLFIEDSLLRIEYQVVYGAHVDTSLCGYRIKLHPLSARRAGAWRSIRT